jgi:hypothetical protein
VKSGKKNSEEIHPENTTKKKGCIMKAQITEPISERIKIPLRKSAGTMKELIDDSAVKLRKELRRFPDKIMGQHRHVTYCGTIDYAAFYQVYYSPGYNA